MRSPSPESTAWNSYVALGGVGNATGDGLVPVDWAHLQGAEQLTLDGCLHSINVAGTTRPTNRAFPAFSISFELSSRSYSTAACKALTSASTSSTPGWRRSWKVSGKECLKYQKQLSDNERDGLFFFGNRAFAFHACKASIERTSLPDARVNLIFRSSCRNLASLSSLTARVDRLQARDQTKPVLVHAAMCKTGRPAASAGCLGIQPFFCERVGHRSKSSHLDGKKTARPAAL